MTCSLHVHKQYKYNISVYMLIMKQVILQSLHYRHYTAALCSQQSLALDRITFCEMASAAKRENVIPFFRFKRRLLRRRCCFFCFTDDDGPLNSTFSNMGGGTQEGRVGEDTTIWVDLRVYDQFTSIIEKKENNRLLIYSQVQL